MRLLKQQCPVLMLFLGWAAYVVGVIFWVLQKDYFVALAWLALVPLGWWAYIRVFPAISRYVGYGSIEDRPAVEVERVATKVTHYTAQGCPFCPVVKSRLLVLQEKMAFDLEEVDVTLRPDLLIAKGIRSVPVVEVGEQRLIGHATSEQLATLIRNGAGEQMKKRIVSLKSSSPQPAE